MVFNSFRKCLLLTAALSLVSCVTTQAPPKAPEIATCLSVLEGFTSQGYAVVGVEAYPTGSATLIVQRVDAIVRLDFVTAEDVANNPTIEWTSECKDADGVIYKVLIQTAELPGQPT